MKVLLRAAYKTRAVYANYKLESVSLLTGQPSFSFDINAAREYDATPDFNRFISWEAIPLLSGKSRPESERAYDAQKLKQELSA